MVKQQEGTYGFVEIWWCETCHEEQPLSDLLFYAYKDGIYPLYYCAKHFPAN